MADETQQGAGTGEGGNTGAETPVNPAELDALFDQVATSDPSATSLAASDESGAGDAVAGGSGAGDPVDGQSGAEGASGDASSTPSSGSPASGAAPAASAPQASDGKGTAASAQPAPEGGAATPAPAATGTQPSAPKTGKQVSPEEENRRLKGRVAALARENDALKRNGTSTPTPSTPAPASGGPGKSGNGGGAPKSKILSRLEADPAWQTVKKDYSEIAAPIERALGELAGEVEQTTAHRQRATLDGNGEIVAKAHPDAGKIVQSKEFNDWLGVQPRYVVAQVEANGDGVRDPDACIDIFNRFKADTGFSSQAPAGSGNNAGGSPSNQDDEATRAARAARRDGAVGGVGKGRGGQTTNLPEDPDKLFDHLAEQVSNPKGGRKAA